jgi:hypothetical protein
MKYLGLLIFSISLLLCNPAFAALTVDNAYVRATPPHAKNSAAFMSIHNGDRKELHLIAASSDIAERVELHNHIMEDGMMKMRRVRQISIPAENNTSLQPGGYHIMLLGLKKALKESETIALKLYFDNDEEIIVDAPVKQINIYKK